MRLIPDHYLQINDLLIFNPLVKRNFKIVALGDIHLSRLVDEKKLSPIKSQLDKEKGDYIVFLGDLIDSPNELNNPKKRNELLSLIKTSSFIAPTMIILGNHDFIVEKRNYKGCDYQACLNEEFWNELASIDNVYLLINDTYCDDQVLFMGYFQTLEYYADTLSPGKNDLKKFYNDFINYPKLFADSLNGLIKIGLIHSPEYAKLDLNVDLLKNYDLLLAGHNHDGCVPFGIGNFHRGIINPKKELFPANVRGYRLLKNGTGLLISGGITKIQDCAPKLIHPLNHLCPMQMDTITFTNDQDKNSRTKRLIYAIKNK